MHQDIAKNRIEIASIFLHSLIILGAVIIFTAPFWHIDFPKQTKYITNLKEELKESENDLILNMDILWSSYEEGSIGAKNYIDQNLILTNQLEQLKSSNSERLKSEIKKHKIFDWNTPRIFLIGFGVRLPYVIFSFIITMLIASRKNDSKKLRIAFVFLQICCWSISAYLMIWVFWSSDDYSLSTYRYALVVASILIGTSCTYFISNYRTTTSGLKSKIRFVMDLMVNKAVSKGHIKNEDAYENEIIFPALKKLDE